MRFLQLEIRDRAIVSLRVRHRDQDGIALEQKPCWLLMAVSGNRIVL